MKKKTIYIIYTEACGENNIVFDDKFKVITAWSCNDATWRDEYFQPLMDYLGVKVLENLPESVDEDKLIKQALYDEMGLEEED